MTTTHPTATIAAFLTAQLDADEAAARAAISASDPEWTAEGQWVVSGEKEYEVADASVPTAHHIARHDPARVLAQVAAMRRIVEWHGGGHECTHYLLTDEPCPTLRALAAVWANHPDYRDEWNRWDEQ